MWDVREMLHEFVGPQMVAWTKDGDGFDSNGESWNRMALQSFMSSIAGGTDEIQKNIIGDRVLGLPRDVSIDKGIPFNELRVGTQSD
jgi:alkylation response protein AidB-like acyl-CoA dehydrogenase